MKKILTSALGLIAIMTGLNAQTTQSSSIDPAPTWGIKFSGFIKSDYFYDTRQNVSIRECHFLLYPSPVCKDSVGKDTNDVKNFNILSIQSRLTGKITGPDAFGAKTSGVIEADFFGNSNKNFDGSHQFSWL